MAASARLSGSDTAFLFLETGGHHMHVGTLFILEGAPPGHDELLEAVDSRLDRLPRLRQKLVKVPLDQGRPVWQDSPRYNPGYHVRHTALPDPGDDAALARLMGRLLAQPLYRDNPMWELWLVEGLQGDRWALFSKMHHALADGSANWEATQFLFDAESDQREAAPTEPAWPSSPPPRSKILLDALRERAVQPSEFVRRARAIEYAPQTVLLQLAGAARGVMTAVATGLDVAPASPLNVEIGPHRRFQWREVALRDVKRAGRRLGGTINDVVLSAVALALGRFLRSRGVCTSGLVLRALVPVSVRSRNHSGELGNRITRLYAPLPVGIEDPLECFHHVHASTVELKNGSQAMIGVALAALADLAPPSVLAATARLLSTRRLANLAVTNMRGPSEPLRMLGRKVTGTYCSAPLSQGQALNIATVSYDGKLGFGLTADFDGVPDLDNLADDLERSLRSLTGLGTARAPPAAE
jgi:diacylglycerol O-acyltransferase